MKKERRVWKSEYKKRFPEGDKLSRIARLIDWNAFDPILEPLFKNTGEGRPHVNVVLMMKVLVLQSWYGLADEMVETECKDRLTFQNFLGYPSEVPDSRTVWLFKERIANAGKEKELWDELQRQLKKYRVIVKKHHGPSGPGRFTTRPLVQPLARLDAEALLRIPMTSFAS